MVEIQLSSWPPLIPFGGGWGRTPPYCLVSGSSGSLLTSPCLGSGGCLLTDPHMSSTNIMVLGARCSLPLEAGESSGLPFVVSLHHPDCGAGGIPRYSQAQMDVEAPCFAFAGRSGKGLPCFLWCLVGVGWLLLDYPHLDPLTRYSWLFFFSFSLCCWLFQIAGFSNIQFR